MKLSQLLSIYPELFFGESPTCEINDVCSESQLVTSGSVFVAIRGSKVDGHQFVSEVCRKGAAAVVVEDRAVVPKDYVGAVAVVKDTRVALDQLASQFYGNPANQLFCVGITGTNGKTTTTYMVEKIFSSFGWMTGVMGTIDHHLGEKVWPTSLTTPGALVLQKRLSEFVENGAQAVAMEVSSHALEQKRADSVSFDVVLFTNLTRDHLDYHKTMDHYFSAKERLFQEVLRKSSKKNIFAIINGEDSYARRLHVSESARVWSFGEKDCDFTYQIIKNDYSGTTFDILTPRGSARLVLKIPGRHNVMNALGALAIGIAANVSLETCVRALSEFKNVPGRMQPVETNKGFYVFVDYAHTPDALEKAIGVLTSLREQQKNQNKVIVVFGCGGDRDQGKRSQMGFVANKMADVVIVTSDNPRSENPQTIIDQIVAPIAESKSVLVEVDRRKAIKTAMDLAQPGDAVLIAGKGHENYQIIGSTTYPFSDVKVVEEFANGMDA